MRYAVACIVGNLFVDFNLMTWLESGLFVVTNASDGPDRAPHSKA